MSSNHSSTSAATDVAEFLTDLDGGQFERMLSIAISQVAAGTCDNDGKGEVNIKLAFTKVPGASQVICAHTLKFTRPTADGKAGEEATRKTPLHVGNVRQVDAHARKPIPNVLARGHPHHQHPAAGVRRVSTRVRRQHCIHQPVPFFNNASGTATNDR